MNKKIIFLTEMGFTGKVPRLHNNMRVEFAQMCALNADHHPMLSIEHVIGHYDYAILLIGKTSKFRDEIYNLDIVSLARKFADKVYFMQEGPSWIFHDMPLHHQYWHYNILVSVDGILTENTTDIPYYKGINPNVPVHDIPSLMIEDSISHISTNISRTNTIIGGTFCRWYGGFDSYLVARTFDLSIYAPSMGRKRSEEDQIEDLTFLPYMVWTDWINSLNQFKYAVHLMPTFAAGTFAMNCAYLGIPCIGYDTVDTQRNLHPELSVQTGDLFKAKQLALKLYNDHDFYNTCSIETKERYKIHHSEQSFKEKMKIILS